MFDIGVYLFFALVNGGLFAALWLASDFFTAIVGWLFVGPFVIPVSIGPSMLFGRLFATAARSCAGWFKSKPPPHSSAGHPAHAAT